MKLEWFAGVDWGSQQHQVCVLDADGKVLGERAFEHGGAGLSAMAAWLLSLTTEQAGDVRRGARDAAWTGGRESHGAGFRGPRDQPEAA